MAGGLHHAHQLYELAVTSLTPLASVLHLQSGSPIGTSL